MENYIAITSNGEDINGKIISAHKKSEFYLSNKIWCLYKNTPNKSKVKPGDKIFIYIAGNKEYCQSFSAIAEVFSIQNNFNNTNYIYPNDISSCIPVYILNLMNIIYLNSHASIHTIIDKLSFIPKNKKKWGCAIQRGLKHITSNDAALIESFIT